MSQDRSDRRASVGRRSGSFRSLGKNIGWLLGGRGFAAVFSLAYLAILTRTLGPADFGHFALITGTAQAVAALVSFQTWQVVVRYGMDHLRSASAKGLTRLVKYCLLLDAGGAVVGAAIAVPVVLLLAPRFGWSDEQAWLALGFAAASLLAATSTPAGLLRLHDRFAISAVAESVQTAMRLAGAVLVWLTQPTIANFVYVWIAAELVTVTGFWALAVRYADGFSWRAAAAAPRQTLDENPGLLRFSLVSNAGRTFVLVRRQLPVLLTGLFAAPAAAGGFRLALQLGSGLANLAKTVTRAIFPELMRSRTFDAAAGFSRLMRRSMTAALLTGAAMFAVLLLAGEAILGFIAGTEFVPFYPLLLIIGGAAIVEFAGVGLEPALYAGGRETQVFVISLTVTSAYLLAMILLGSEYGAYGVAWATLGAAVLQVALLALSARRSFAAGQDAATPDERG